MSKKMYTLVSNLVDKLYLFGFNCRINKEKGRTSFLTEHGRKLSIKIRSVQPNPPPVVHGKASTHIFEKLYD